MVFVFADCELDPDRSNCGGTERSSRSNSGVRCARDVARGAASGRDEGRCWARCGVIASSANPRSPAEWRRRAGSSVTSARKQRFIHQFVGDVTTTSW